MKEGLVSSELGQPRRLAEYLQRISALRDGFASFAPLRGADELVEIGATVPNGFIRHDFAGHQNRVRIDSARRERRRRITQPGVSCVMVLYAFDQSNLAVGPENTRQRMHHFCANREDTGATQTKSKRHVQSKRAAISKTGQHEPARIEPTRAQLLVQQWPEVPRRAI